MEKEILDLIEEIEQSLDTSHYLNSDNWKELAKSLKLS